MVLTYAFCFCREFDQRAYDKLVSMAYEKYMVSSLLFSYPLSLLGFQIDNYMMHKESYP